MLAPSAPASSAACLTCGEARDQRRATRLDEHVAQSARIRSASPAWQPREEHREVRALRDERRRAHMRPSSAARAARVSSTASRMHEHAVPSVAGTGIGNERSVGRQHETAEQHRADVVAVTAAARDRFAGQRERIERARRAAAGRAVHWPRRAQRRPTRPSRPCRSRTECPCRVRSRSRTAALSAIAQRDQRGACRVALGFERQSALRSRESRRCARRVSAMRRTRDAVAGPVDRVAEDVEADTDVADRGRRERRGDASIAG